MKISYNWLKQFINIDLKSEDTADVLTDLGLEVEGVENFESIKGGLKGLVVGHVLTCEKHENADKLKVFRIIQTEQGHNMKRVFEAGNELKYKDVEMSEYESYIFDTLEDVPH